MGKRLIWRIIYGKYRNTVPHGRAKGYTMSPSLYLIGRGFWVI
jgi:hypothetical protein